MIQDYNNDTTKGVHYQTRHQILAGIVNRDILEGAKECPNFIRSCVNMPEQLLKELRTEYDLCLHLYSFPEESPGLFGISARDEIVKYYGCRVEGLGYALDRLERFFQEINQKTNA